MRHLSIPRGRPLVVSAAVGLLAAIAALDYLTGPRIAFSIFYLAPISLVAWSVGRRAGVVLSLLSAAVWLLVDRASMEYPTEFIYLWNAAVRLGFFVTVSLLLSNLRAVQDGLEETVRDRTGSLATEVEEHRKALLALDASESRYRSLYSSMSEGVALHELLTDAEGRAVDYVILDVNPAYESILGMSRHRAVGARASELYGAGTPPYLDRYAEVVRTGQRCRFETVFEPMGKAFRISVFSPQEGQFATVFEDITERRRSREDILRKNRDLETLLYVSSHDLREPLRAIQSFSRLVADRYTSVLDEKGRDFLGRIIRGGERMERLMDDLLALSRAQRLAAPTETVSGLVVVQEAVDRLTTRIREAGAKVQIAESFPDFLADRTWATQAVYNLLANALKFTRKGASPEVEIAPYVSQSHGNAEVGVVVRDRGPGVAPEYRERIFELFQRVVSREVEGTGAGLAIVRQVAERHGGRAWVQPREGGGSEFIVTFGAATAKKGVEA